MSVRMTGIGVPISPVAFPSSVGIEYKRALVKRYETDIAEVFMLALSSGWLEFARVGYVFLPSCLFRAARGSSLDGCTYVRRVLLTIIIYDLKIPRG